MTVILCGFCGLCVQRHPRLELRVIQQREAHRVEPAEEHRHAEPAERQVADPSAGLSRVEMMEPETAAEEREQHGSGQVLLRRHPNAERREDRFERRLQRVAIRTVRGQEEAPPRGEIAQRRLVRRAVRVEEDDLADGECLGVEPLQESRRRRARQECRWNRRAEGLGEALFEGGQ